MLERLVCFSDELILLVVVIFGSDEVLGCTQR